MIHRLMGRPGPAANQSRPMKHAASHCAIAAGLIAQMVLSQ